MSFLKSQDAVWDEFVRVVKNTDSNSENMLRSLFLNLKSSAERHDDNEIINAGCAVLFDPNSTISNAQHRAMQFFYERGLGELFEEKFTRLMSERRKWAQRTSREYWENLKNDAD